MAPLPPPVPMSLFPTDISNDIGNGILMLQNVVMLR